jgi:sulfonate transport system substrate-binding protein
VTWTLSQGSNKANEALRGGAIDVASTAGSAALVARANGGPNVIVEVLGLPEWSAIVVPAGSDIEGPEDLAGATVAATTGTDTYFFLLQTLAEADLSLDDVEVVNLQHADGRTALVRGDVDAWAGLDPIMADAELTDGFELAVRAPGRNTFSVLNVREDWLVEHPDAVELGGDHRGGPAVDPARAGRGARGGGPPGRERRAGRAPVDERGPGRHRLRDRGRPGARRGDRHRSQPDP